MPRRPTEPRAGLRSAQSSGGGGQAPPQRAKKVSGKSNGSALQLWQRRVIAQHLRAGTSKTEIARAAGISRTTLYGFLESHGLSDNKPPPDMAENPEVARFTRSEESLKGPLHEKQMTPEARRALKDFGYFRRRYLGRGDSPWQVEAAYRMVALLESPDKEYAVVNCPPGVGKSTLFTHDLVVWLICRNRAVRIMVGSRTYRQAEYYTARVRRTLERLDPPIPSSEDVLRGVAFEPEAVLVEDFGRFRPFTREVWQRATFIVAQHDDLLVMDKEPTVAAYGMDSGFLGNRFDLIVWDDLVDKKTLTQDGREAQIAWWDAEAETRLEPGGLLILQGQRMRADDLYRYALDTRIPPDDWDPSADPDVPFLEDPKPDPSGDDVDDPAWDSLPRKYHHIIYPAHFEDRCQKVHRRSARAYPEGCLLDPYRLPWRELVAISHNKPERYAVLYQQEDVDPATVLVPYVHIKGGRGDDGIEYPGCWDPDRLLGTIPKGLVPPVHSVATSDPSPSRWWVNQWWIYQPSTEQRFLIDQLRGPLRANEFLDWNQSEGVYTGVMEEWYQRSKDLGQPIGAWIVEANAAQRFLLQYDHVRRWSSSRGVNIVPHETYRNRSDPDFGVDLLRPQYRFGRVRLPGANPGRNLVMPLVREVTRYPDCATDDCVMAQWFLEWTLPRLYPKTSVLPQRPRPSWLRAVPGSPSGAKPRRGSPFRRPA